MKKPSMKENEEKRLDSKSSREMNKSLDRVLLRLKVYAYSHGESDWLTKFTIAETLLKLPCNVRKKTLDEVIFINMEVNGGIMFWTNPIVKLKMKAIIFLCPRPTSPKSEQMNIIAHEIAHFILGHLRFKKHRKPEEAREREADDLAVKWGFKRQHKSYRRLASS